MSNEMRKMINKISTLGCVSKQKYKGVGARNLMEGFAMNSFSVKKENDPTAKTVYFGLENDKLSEKISFEFDQKGGIIVFSVNVNALKISNNKLVNWVRNKIETLKNTILKDKKISKVLSRHEEVYGITIGGFVKGRYRADNGLLYDERSLSVEIIGITTDVLNKVAEDMAKEFRQETVLVKNYEEDKIYLVK